MQVQPHLEPLNPGAAGDSPEALRLAERLRELDAASWPALLPMLREVARSTSARFRDVATADDILGELALHAWDKWLADWAERQLARTEPRSLPEFLRDRLRDHLREMRRREQRRRALLQPSTEGPAVETEGGIGAAILATDLPRPDEALDAQRLRDEASVDEQARAILLLRESGYSQEEIARALDVSRPTVTRRLAAVAAVVAALVAGTILWFRPWQTEPALDATLDAEVLDADVPAPAAPTPPRPAGGPDEAPPTSSEPAEERRPHPSGEPPRPSGEPRPRQTGRAPAEAPALPSPPVERPRASTIYIESDPDGAEIWHGQQRVGVTPFEYPRPTEGTEHVLTLRHTGYDPFSIRVGNQSGRSTVYLAPERPAPSPPAPAGPGSMRDSPTREEVFNAMLNMQRHVRPCRAGGPHDSLVVEVVFESTGRIREVTQVRPTGLSRDAIDCILREVRRATIAPFRAPTYTMQWVMMV